MIAVSIVMAIWTALLAWMQLRTEKRRATNHPASADVDDIHGTATVHDTESQHENIVPKV
jgi:ACS family pantothenate transporter-like MFS transporter